MQDDCKDLNECSRQSMRKFKQPAKGGKHLCLEKCQHVVIMIGSGFVEGRRGGVAKHLTLKREGTSQWEGVNKGGWEDSVG